tara:strand:+ start:190 stop:774 length:585 start_codon:yes stop_codon:yes gene_type:complete
MAFWADAGLADPKRAYRFTCILPLPNMGVDTKWFIKSVAKPTISVSEANHTYLNHTFYYPGRVSWSTINVTLVDPFSPDAAATFSKYLETSGYKPPGSPDDLQTISKSTATSELGIVEINQIDAAGVTIEKWELHNAWIKNINFSDLDYESDALSNVSIEIRYDWATCRIHGPISSGTGPQSGDPIFATETSTS